MPQKKVLETPREQKRKYFTKTQEVLPLPNLIEVQTNSYNWFLSSGIKEVFEEISPVTDFTGTVMELNFGDYYLEEPKYSEKVAKEKNATYEASLKVKIELKNLETKKTRAQEVFLGDLPLMTDRGTFIINGVERVVVSQLIRSPGAFFTKELAVGQELFGGKIIPRRGAWLEFETSSNNVIWVKIDRKRKIPVTTLIRAFGYPSDEELIKLFSDVNTNSERDYIKATIEKDPTKNTPDAFMEVYRRIRPGDLATPENSKTLIEGMFFDLRKYDLSRVGRYKMNKRLEMDIPNTKENRILRKEDLVSVIKEIIRLNNEGGKGDDIDHLGNRRVRTIGELIQDRFRIGLTRVERIIKDRMSIFEPESVTPAQLINVRPIVAAVREFFASSQLSHFMDQTNPLSEIANKRKLSAMGPGGLSRERAGFEVRDVHRTHYGRICPIETPEGPNIGLVNSLACYARINEFGFIETPYRKVIHEVPNKPEKTKDQIIRETITDKSGKEIIKNGEEITEAIAKKIAQLDKETITIKSTVTNKIEYLDASEEEKAVIAEANAPIDTKSHFIEDRISVRRSGEADEESSEMVNYMDISSKQIVSVAAGLIPFIEHDDAKRALMGANMQRQAVPLVSPEAPKIGTGIETKVAADSGQVILAETDGVVTSVTGDTVKVKYKKGEEVTYDLIKFKGSNANTCINQKPQVVKGQKVKKGELLVDGAAIDGGELALGRNILVCYMSWGGANFEDAVIISERLVKEDIYTSIHIEEFITQVRDTKLGPEIVTRDIPNVGEEALRDLDEDGVVRIGAEVVANDILVGKITPKGETELTAEERLLRAIFGEKARDVKDTSLRLPSGEHGKVVEVKIFSREKGDELPPGVIQEIRVYVAQMRKVSIGDKMAGRHGNKGVISKILPAEDMPYLADGTPVDIILNPLGVVSRMNIGQILETHLGWAAKTLGYKVASPVFDGVTVEKIREELKKAKLPEDGKIQLYNGQTGEPFDQKSTVGVNYILKLCHLVEDKIHARSTGPYAMVTQQPLGGKAQMGGQRFGEMEVWALEGYGAAHTLQEILTIKSDDVVGRSKAYESIIKNEEIKEPRVPESFNVLVRELQSLALAIDLIHEKKTQKRKIDAEKVIEKGYEKAIEELESNKLIVGENPTPEVPTIDISEPKTEDEFEVLEEVEKKPKDSKK